MVLSRNDAPTCGFPSGHFVPGSQVATRDRQRPLLVFRSANLKQAVPWLWDPSGGVYQGPWHRARLPDGSSSRVYASPLQASVSAWVRWRS
jgi:hypothetical protein